MLSFRIRFLVLVVFAIPHVASGEEMDVYLFAGQSNMDGRGKVEKLSEEQRKPFFAASIYYRNPPHSSLGWKVLAPGFSIPPKHKDGLPSVSYTHLTLPTTPYV